MSLGCRRFVRLGWVRPALREHDDQLVKARGSGDVEELSDAGSQEAAREMLGYSSSSPDEGLVAALMSAIEVHSTSSSKLEEHSAESRVLPGADLPRVWAIGASK